jgi:hypothetical protein
MTPFPLRMARQGSARRRRRRACCRRRAPGFRAATRPSLKALAPCRAGLPSPRPERERRLDRPAALLARRLLAEELFPAPRPVSKAARPRRDPTPAQLCRSLAPACRRAQARRSSPRRASLPARPTLRRALPRSRPLEASRGSQLAARAAARRLPLRALHLRPAVGLFLRRLAGRTPALRSQARARHLRTTAA